jgi:hypothetical protein
VPDALYVAARRVLLDALAALEPHLEGLVLVGAQASYVHTGEGDLAVAPYTTDGDLALSPSDLAAHPTLEEALLGVGFVAGDQPGRWIGSDSMVIDLMVPDALGGPGRRGARLGPHGVRSARKARGLGATLVDRSRVRLEALDAADRRSVMAWVAGPAALLVAKLHKIAERIGTPGRRDDKDALDVLRLLQHVPTDKLASDLIMLLRQASSAEETREALLHLERLFGLPSAEGSRMAVRATELLENPDTIAASCAILTGDLLAAVERASARAE